MLICPEVSLRPFAGRGILAKEQHTQCHGVDDDERDNVGHTPGFVGSEVLRSDEGVVDGGHDEAKQEGVSRYTEGLNRDEHTR